MDDNSMIGPGAHEIAATNAINDGNTEDAKVYALLALASAVNRLAAAQEATVDRGSSKSRTSRDW